MNILFASVTDSGILRVRSDLIRQLLNDKHKVVVVALQEKDYLELIDLGCVFRSIEFDQHGMNPIQDLRLLNEYICILKQEKPDVVCLFTTKPNVYCGIACRILHIPVIMNITALGVALGNKSLAQYLLIKLYKLATNGRNVRTIFFQNQDSLTFFQKNRIGKTNVYKRINGSGVNLTSFPFLPFPMDDAEYKIHILFIGRVIKQKGIDIYIEAAKCIRKKHPEVVFHVIGDADDYYREILDKASIEKIISYEGRRNDISEWHKISQCTIQPSFYPEGMSNVILEAAASGRPVITTNHPGCREGIDDGITGFLIPIKDVNALVDAISKFLSLTYQQKKEMGRKARLKMEAEFDRQNVTDAYINAIFRG